MLFRHPTSVSAYFFAIVCFVLAASSTMSACTQGQRQDTLRVTLASVNTARDRFGRWDDKHQQEIANTVATREEAERLDAEYLTRQKVLVDGFMVVYQALAVAATQTDTPSLEAALAASQDLLRSVATLVGDVTPTPTGGQ